MIDVEMWRLDVKLLHPPLPTHTHSLSISYCQGPVREVIPCVLCSPLLPSILPSPSLFSTLLPFLFCSRCISASHLWDSLWGQHVNPSSKGLLTATATFSLLVQHVSISAVQSMHVFIYGALYSESTFSRCIFNRSSPPEEENIPLSSQNNRHDAQIPGRSVPIVCSNGPCICIKCCSSVAMPVGCRLLCSCSHVLVSISLSVILLPCCPFQFQSLFVPESSVPLVRTHAFREVAG